MSRCPEDCKLLCCKQRITEKKLACNLGVCMSDKILQRSQRCNFKRDGYTYSYLENYDLKYNLKSKVPYNEPLLKRFHFFLVFLFKQNEINSGLDYNLLDIAFDLKLVSYHGSKKHVLYREPLRTPSSTDYNNEYTPMMENMYFSIFLINICDKTLAKKKEYTLEDLMEKNTFEEKVFKEGIYVLEEKYVYIPCGQDCSFQEHNITLCFEFRNNFKVCLLNKNAHLEDYYFNIGKFGIVMIVNYLDWLHQIRIQNPNVENNDKHEFDENFKISEGGTGRSVLIKEFFIQGSYKPILKPVTYDKLINR
jgi:hypothetical protein